MELIDCLLATICIDLEGEDIVVQCWYSAVNRTIC